jgi:DNA-directed RNA polymerase subunit K/omega
MCAQLQTPSPVDAGDLREPSGLGPESVTGVPQGRFLFVDVAGLRAKQLRAGARPRIDTAGASVPHKPEWVAMEEVRCGRVRYDLPDQL